VWRSDLRKESEEAFILLRSRSVGQKVKHVYATKLENPGDRFLNHVVRAGSARRDADCGVSGRKPFACLDFLLLVLVVVGDEVGGVHLLGVLDEIGGELGLAHFGQMAGVAAVVPSDNDEEIERILKQNLQGVLPFLRGTANGVEKAKMVVELLIAVAVNDGLLDTALNLFRFIAHHGGLVGHADGFQMFVGVEAFGVGTLEFFQERDLLPAVADVVADIVGFFQRIDDQIVTVALVIDGAGGGGHGLFVPRFSVDDGGDFFPVVLADALPDAHHVSAGRIDKDAALFLEGVHGRHFGPEGGNDDHVLLRQPCYVVTILAPGEGLDVHLPELFVHVGIVDDFPQQMDGPVGEDLCSGIGEVDGALDSVAKAECLGQFDGESVCREGQSGVANVIDDAAAIVLLDLGLDEIHHLGGAEVDFAGAFEFGHRNQLRRGNVSRNFAIRIRGHYGACRRLFGFRLKTPFDDGLLRVQTVLRLIENIIRPLLENLLGDFLAPIGRKAVHDDGIRLGNIE